MTAKIAVKMLASTAIGLLALSGCNPPASQTGEAVQDQVSRIEHTGEVVAAKIDFEDQECIGKGLPIAVYLKNESAAPTVRVGWSFSVNKKGHSTDLAGFSERVKSMNDPSRQTDRIIEPGETFKVCSTAPDVADTEPTDELEYRVLIDRAPTAI